MRNSPWTPTINPRRWAFATVGLTLVLMTAFLVFTPLGQAFAQEILQFFTHAEGDVIPHSPVRLTAIASLEYEETLNPTPYQTTTPVPGAVYDVDLTEAGQYAGFNLMVPHWIPDSISFEGASFDPAVHYAWISYQHTLYPDQGGVLLIREEPTNSTSECRLCKPMEVGASEPVEIVQFGNTTGEFSTGTWYGTDTEKVWEDTPLVKTLRWQANGMVFEMIDYGTPDMDMGLTKDQMMLIAKSIK